MTSCKADSVERACVSRTGRRRRSAISTNFPIRTSGTRKQTVSSNGRRTRDIMYADETLSRVTHFERACRSYTNILRVRASVRWFFELFENPVFIPKVHALFCQTYLTRTVCESLLNVAYRCASATFIYIYICISMKNRLFDCTAVAACPSIFDPVVIEFPMNRNNTTRLSSYGVFRSRKKQIIRAHIYMRVCSFNILFFAIVDFRLRRDLHVCFPIKRLPWQAYFRFLEPSAGFIEITSCPEDF